MTPALPPIEYELRKQSSELTVPHYKKRMPAGKSGIPVFTGRRRPSNSSNSMRRGNERGTPQMARGKSIPNGDREPGSRYRARGAYSRAGNHPRLTRSHSDDNIPRLPPISPRRRIA